MRGFKSHESATRFRRCFDELRNHQRPHSRRGRNVSTSSRRHRFLSHGIIAVRIMEAARSENPVPHSNRLNGPITHGTRKACTPRRRFWRKFHIGIAAKSGEIIAIELTGKDVDDAARAAALIGEITDPNVSFTADGAYGQDRVYDAVAERHPDAAVIVPPRSTAAWSASAGTAPTRRDPYIDEIAQRGRMGRRKSNGYNVRAKVEAAIGWFKRVIGDSLRSRTDDAESNEIATPPEPRIGCWTSGARIASGSPE